MNSDAADIKLSGIFNWNLTPEQLKYQLDNYSTLPITKSYKGLSFIIIIVMLAVSGIAVALFPGLGSSGSFVLSLFLYVPFLSGLYKGKKSAINWIIGTVIAIKLLQLIFFFMGSTRDGDFNLLSSLIIAFVLLSFLMKAQQIETAREKQAEASILAQQEVAKKDLPVASVMQVPS